MKQFSTIQPSNLPTCKIVIMMVGLFFTSPHRVLAKWLAESNCPFLEQKKAPPILPCTCNSSGNYTQIFFEDDYITTPTNWVNEQIWVIGTLHISAQVDMTNCTFFLESEASIIIENKGRIVATDHCLFRGCSAMWKEILVKSGGSIATYQSKFQNARTAINFESGYLEYLTKIDRNIFENNQIGINIGDSNNSITQTFPIVGNKFIATGANLLSPLQNEKPMFGIAYWSCGYGSIWGDSRNTFSGMRNGISLSESNVSLSGCTFSNARIDDLSNPAHGYGVVATEGSWLKVRNSSFGNDQGGGIYMDRLAGADIQFSSFYHEGTFGVRLENSHMAASVNVSNDTFEMDQEKDISAIRVWRPTNLIGNNNAISNNVINASGLKRKNMALIECVSPNNLAKGYLYVLNNNLTVTTAPFDPSPLSANGLPYVLGIYIHGDADGYSVRGNSLNYSAAPPLSTQKDWIGSLGIAVINASGRSNFIVTNFISSTLNTSADVVQEEASSWLKCGFHLDNSLDWTLCANFVVNTYRGIHFSRELGECDYSHNTMMQAYYGYLCQSGTGSTDMIDQLRHENHWPATYVKFSAEYHDPLVAGSPLFRFFEQAVDIPTNYTPSGWFVSVPANYPSNTNCDPHLNAKLTDRDKKIIENTWGFATPNEAWDLRRELLFRLMKYPELQPTGSLANSFYQYWENSSEWKYAKAEFLLIDALQSPEVNSAAISGLGEEISNLNRQQFLLDSLQNIDLTTFDAAIEAQKQTVLENQKTKWSNLRLARKNATIALNSKLTTVQNFNNQLTDTEIYQLNRKSFLTLALKKNKGQSWSSSDVQTIRSIAEQCPNLGGEIVIKSAWWLPNEEPLKYVDENYYRGCYEVTPRNQDLAIDLIENTIRIAPNPVSEQLTIQFLEPMIGNWEIFNVNGQLMSQGQISEAISIFPIKTNDLKQGLYCLKFKSASGSLISKKFTVIH